MKPSTSKTSSGRTVDDLPVELQDFVASGRSTIHTSHSVWDLRVADPDPDLARLVPTDTIVIGESGAGDSLFIRSSCFGEASEDTPVFAYWHEDASWALEAESLLETLKSVEERAPTTRADVLYCNSDVLVLPGDLVALRSFFRWKNGAVTYVPGISKMDPEMEFNGLAWVRVRMDSGTVVGTLVDPEASCLLKSVRFVSRG